MHRVPFVTLRSGGAPKFGARVTDEPAQPVSTDSRASQ